MSSGVGVDNIERNVVFAIVVTYEPDEAVLIDVVKNISVQVDTTIVVDNSEKTDVKRVIGDTFGKDVRVLTMGGNRGIGRAHNKGIEYAVNQGATHVVLMDQDSLAEEGMVAALLAVVETKICEGERVAAAGARYKEVESGRYSAFVRFGWFKFRQVLCPEAGEGKVVTADFLISSGSMIPVQTLKNVGVMDSDLFIDHVDTEWFLRAKSKGYNAYGVCDAIMSHRLGEGSIRIWLGRWRGLPKHSPVRYYYIIRNSILLYKRDYAPLKWITGDLTRLMVIVVFYTLIQAPRWSRLKMMARGLMDGVAGRNGQYQLQN
jgi:rhamnosyltransferase